MSRIAILVVSCFVPLAGLAAEDRKPDVRFVPTPPEVMDRMLEAARITEKDVVYDLGCGDGRIVLAAAKKFTCKAVGYDIDTQRIKECEANKSKESKEVQKLVTFVKADVLKLDVSGASVILLYMSREVNEKLIPAFKKLKDGSRIVAHNYPIPGVKPDKGFPIVVKKKNGYEAEVYRYVTPLKLED
jgi:precorrin-6B methylase 2